MERINQWAYQWKMQFNPDPKKQANAVIFSHKSVSHGLSHPPIKFNERDIKKCNHQKHLGVILDSSLNFNTHIDQKIKKCNKLIGLLRRLSVNLPRNALLTIYKSFIRPHLDYGDILYDKPNNEIFQNKIERIQYRACLAITGAIQSTSREKVYDEFGLHSLAKRRWRSKLIFFYIIVNRLLPDYLYSYLDFPSQNDYLLRSASTSIIRPFPSRTKSFKKSFFRYCIIEWNHLTVKIRSAKSINFFKKSIIKEKKENSLFGVYNPLGVKLLTHLRLQFRHLNEHKFKHGFSDTVDPMCACLTEVETTDHFFLRCHLYNTQRLELFENLKKIDSSFFNLNEKYQVTTLLYGSQTNDSKCASQEILKFVITYIKATTRFDRPLINNQ